MFETDHDPLFRMIHIARFFHKDSCELYQRIANLNLVDLEVTVEPIGEGDKPFDEVNLLTFGIDEGALDLYSYILDRNEKPLFQNDIVAVWFADKAIGTMGDTKFEVRTAADVIYHPQKRFNYFVAEIKFSRGMFYLVHPILKAIVPLSNIPQPFIELIGNSHQHKYLINQEPPHKQQA